MSTRSTLTTKRLEALRQEMKRAGVDGYIVPRGDRYFGEEVRPHDERLAFLTGFTGSAGMALICEDKAMLLVDGRYTLQAIDQLADTEFTIADLTQPNHMSFFGTLVENGKVKNRTENVGFDPWLVSVSAFKRLEQQCTDFGIALKACDNLVDAIWPDRPDFKPRPLFRHAFDYAGQDVADKLKSTRRMQPSYMLVTAPDNLSWLANIRGQDLLNTPSALGIGLITPGGLDIFVPNAQLDEALFQTDEAVEMMDEAHFEDYLKKFSGSTIQLDPASCPLALQRMFEDAGWSVTHKADPITHIKAQKNDVEQQNIRRAHQLDGVAITKFLAWFDKQINNGAKLDELDVIAQLEQCRQESEDYQGPSFDTIAGAGPNGAIVHYRANTQSNRAILPGDILLLDSGGQYLFGTTDITRTIATGPVTDHQKKMFTLVLKGMIGVSQAQFPQDTPGSQIDTYARAPLWREGLDFAHGTGHGVGVYLNVHEGPIGISRRSHTGFKPGMLVSNEPGYYEAGAFGIRIENLVLSQTVPTEGFLQFETVTLAPIDKRLIEKNLLSEDELDWLNAYHAHVNDTLAPHLDEETTQWLSHACAPL